ncbi:MAG TPA: acylphosphatase [Gemmatimonadaceae bacterium]|nr:acylphosphatase [Gemmatimonadaceae bacterium]
MVLHVRVVGRVQGVGFRWFVREVGRRQGLAGWVKNRADGSVEVAADGPAEAIAALRNALGSGPQGAHVDDVADLPDDQPHALPRPFAILK